MATIDQWVLDMQQRRARCTLCDGAGYVLLCVDQVAAPIGAEPCPECSGWGVRSEIGAAMRLSHALATYPGRETDEALMDEVLADPEDGG